MTPRGGRDGKEFGDLRFAKIGASGARTDPYHWLMEMRWPTFVAVVTAAFCIINLAFAMIFNLMPGAVANMAPGSLRSAFFFSSETLATVGYGAMSPATTGGHLVATIEMLVGLFFSATITGLIFARFARPRTMLVCSRVAVVAPHCDGLALMVRIASLRSHPVTDLTAQLFWLRRAVASGGQGTTLFTELPLVERRVPVLPLCWTLIHPLDKGSPVLEALDAGADLRFLLSVSGTYSLLGNPTVSDHVYGKADIRSGARFADVVSEDAGVFIVDLRRLHDTVPSGPDDKLPVPDRL